MKRDAGGRIPNAGLHLELRDSSGTVVFSTNGRRLSSASDVEESRGVGDTSLNLSRWNASGDPATRDLEQLFVELRMQDGGPIRKGRFGNCLSWMRQKPSVRLPGERWARMIEGFEVHRVRRAADGKVSQLIVTFDAIFNGEKRSGLLCYERP